MARPKKPCDFCAQDLRWADEGTNGHAYQAEFYPDNNVLWFGSYGRGEDGDLEELEWIIRPEYCPMCGRKIGVY